MANTKIRRRARNQEATPVPYKYKSWTISDELWKRAEPLIPEFKRDPNKKYKRAVGAGRKRIPKRKVFEAIVYVARTGMQWRALPKSEFGVGTAIHKYFLEWSRAGVFERIWQAGLAEYDEMEGIAWLWQSIDGSTNKAPLAQESVGPNPTDRGKNGDKTICSSRRSWRPAFRRRFRGQHSRYSATDRNTGSSESKNEEKG